MSVLFFALAATSVANAFLGPIANGIKVEEKLRKNPQLQVYRLKGRGFVATPDQAFLWSVGVTPEQMDDFEEARALYEEMKSLNPKKLHAMECVLG